MTTTTTTNGHSAQVPTFESTTTSTSTSSTMITEDEAALYDRQLRLWGVEAQNRMRNSNVLIYRFKTLAAEIVKNLVLAGVGKITLLDHQVVEEEDLGGNFFLREDEVRMKRVEAGAPRVQALNPRVTLSTETNEALIEDEQFLSQFDLIVLTDVDAATLSKTNTLTRRLNKKLYAASSIGIDGWIFADLLQHQFLVDVIKTVSVGEPTMVPTKKSLSYSHFDQVLHHSFKSFKPVKYRRTQENLWGTLGQEVTLEGLRKVAQTLLPRLDIDSKYLSESCLSQIARTSVLEYPPTAAILGGIAGQDVLNVIGGKEEPVRNLFVFDGQSGAGTVWALGC